MVALTLHRLRPSRILTRELRYTGKVCVDFYYNMFGQDVGTLRVYRQLGGQNQPGNDLLRLVGQQGRDWIQKRLTVTLNDMRDRVRTRAGGHDVIVCLNVLFLFYLFFVFFFSVSFVCALLSISY